MSIYKRIVTHSGRITGVKAAIAYICNPEKTRKELCQTAGASRKTAYEDFVFVKQLLCQTDGRQYLHWVLSHDQGVTQDIADAVSQEVINLLGEEYQVIAATHTNTDNLHTHFIINTVNITTGKKFSESKADMLRFRDEINKILRTYGLKECGIPEDITEEELDMAETDEYDDMPDLEGEYYSYSESTFPPNMTPEELEAWEPPFAEKTSAFNPAVASDNPQALCPTRNYGCMTDAKSGIQKYEIYRLVDGEMFKGQGGIENGRVYEPGILYAAKAQSPPEMDDSAAEIIQYSGGHVFIGKVYWENGRAYTSGVLYEDEKRSHGISDAPQHDPENQSAREV